MKGFNPRDVDRLYFWGWVMFAIILLGIVGADYLVLRGWSANDHHGPRYAQ